MRIGVSARWLDLSAGGAREYLFCVLQHWLMTDRRNEEEFENLGSHPLPIQKEYVPVLLYQH